MPAEASIRLRPLPRPRRDGRERRRQRSESAAEAIVLALAAAARRASLDAVVVCDDQGMLVAASPCDFDLDPVAAIAPIVGRGKVAAHVRRGDAVRPMRVEPVEVGPELLYVAAIGGDGRGRAREAKWGAAAARRILG
ncbi:MAG: hypothetical protein D6705_07420 [Deltaproteobacteria bacterium]|nr:MAG: hypothetical protein D6705_07420 [Deltaproteobacteria bacterium]